MKREIFQAEISEGQDPPAFHWLLGICLGLCAGVFVLAFLLVTPHWGLMDDAHMIFGTVPELDRVGLLRGAWDYSVKDMSWGMFRPIYPLMAYVLYKPGMMAYPWVTFLLNATFALGLLWAYARFFGKLLGINWRVLLVFNAAFFYQYDLFQHPSLQEKVVLLFGLGFLLAVWRARREIRLPLVILFLLLGFLSKASFVVYFSAGFLLWLVRNKEDLREVRPRAWIETALVAILGILAVLALGYVASKGYYTAQYSLGSIWPNLFSLHGLMLGGPLVAYLLVRAVRWKETLDRPQTLVPAAGLAVFLLLFLPWGIGGYLQTLIGPLYAAMAAQLVFSVLPRPRARVAVLLVGILSVVVCAYRLPTMFQRLNDLGKIVAGWGAWPALAEGGIFMPCMEGAEAMEKFLRAAGHTEVKVKFERDVASVGSGVWIYDNAMCPLPGRALEPEGCGQELFYQPRWGKSYRVVKLSCRGQ